MSIYVIDFICDRFDFSEVISSSIFDIIDSTVNYEKIILTGVPVEDSDLLVALRRPDTQVLNVSSSSSLNQGGFYVSRVVIY